MKGGGGCPYLLMHAYVILTCLLACLFATLEQMFALEIKYKFYKHTCLRGHLSMLACGPGYPGCMSTANGDNEACMTVPSSQGAVALVTFLSVEVNSGKIDYLPPTPKLQPQIPMEKLT